MSIIRPSVVLHLGLHCTEPTGRELTAFLRRAVPFYQNISGVSVKLLHSLDRPAHFIEVIEYATGEAFQADRMRVENDEQMRSLLAQWRELSVVAPEVEHFTDITGQITGGDRYA